MSNFKPIIKREGHKKKSHLKLCINYIKDKARENNWDEQLAPALIDLISLYDSWGGVSSKFQKEFCLEEHFHALLWEMQLAQKLYKSEIEFQIGGSGKPDFFIPEQKIWLEAVCPKPNGIPKDYLDYPKSTPAEKIREVTTIKVPSSEILLRWTSAIHSKIKQVEKYIRNGIIDKNHPFIIAVNCSQLGNPRHSFIGQSGYPYPVEIGYGVGPLTAYFDKYNPDKDKIESPYRSRIQNLNDKEVDTAIFFSDKYKKISAIIGDNSGLNEIVCMERNEFVITHNRYADNTLPTKLFKNSLEFTIAERSNDSFEIIKII
ncbi:hypothetical protein A8135_09410 [Legionella jamestowniensis]|uniref:Restriction endonuclease n=1 Tax=Legionella jamestowniensis TaxID=455 RepID=A0ABX2XWG4_9GAMM|nr:hypothetical protein [Legionella jamestowniensis]OCH98964.1 hypothetical protein A8135_09410 [Legionella jamestowniensis]